MNKHFRWPTGWSYLRQLVKLLLLVMLGGSMLIWMRYYHHYQRLAKQNGFPSQPSTKVTNGPTPSLTDGHVLF